MPGPKDRTDEPRETASNSAEESARRPLEALFQEAVRRTATAGLWSFFLTEEAVRRAFSEAVPQDWIERVTRQSDDLRRETLESLSREVGRWLASLDPAEVFREVAGEVLRTNDIRVTLDISASPREPRASLQVVPRQK